MRHKILVPHWSIPQHKTFLARAVDFFLLSAMRMPKSTSTSTHSNRVRPWLSLLLQRGREMVVHLATANRAVRIASKENFHVPGITYVSFHLDLEFLGIHSNSIELFEPGRHKRTTIRVVSNDQDLIDFLSVRFPSLNLNQNMYYFKYTIATFSLLSIAAVVESQDTASFTTYQLAR